MTGQEQTTNKYDSLSKQQENYNGLTPNGAFTGPKKMVNLKDVIGNIDKLVEKEKNIAETYKQSGGQ